MLIRRMTQKVVPQELACLERYPSAPIPANHADMCKFSQRDDAGYQEASSVLREWVETLERRADKEVCAHKQPGRDPKLVC